MSLMGHGENEPGRDIEAGSPAVFAGYDLVGQLRRQAVEIAKAGHNGWGNTMLLAADEIERLRS